MSIYEDEDGIDGPFDRAIERAIHEDAEEARQRRIAEREDALAARGLAESLEALRYHERHDPATCTQPKPCEHCLRVVQFTPGFKGERTT